MIGIFMAPGQRKKREVVGNDLESTFAKECRRKMLILPFDDVPIRYFRLITPATQLWVGNYLTLTKY